MLADLSGFLRGLFLCLLHERAVILSSSSLWNAAFRSIRIKGFRFIGSRPLIPFHYGKHRYSDSLS